MSSGLAYNGLLEPHLDLEADGWAATQVFLYGTDLAPPADAPDRG